METVQPINQLTRVIESIGLEVQTGNYIKEKFLPFFEQAEEWKLRAQALVVTDISQTADMKMARIARLALKEIRVNADKTRKELKEDSLRYGKAVQGVYNVIEFLISHIEKHLQEQEDFAAIYEGKKRAEIKANREMELQPFAEFVPFGLDLGAMSESDFQKTLNGAKLQLQAKIEAEQRAETERIAKEKAEAEERERVKVENEKLKAEVLAREKQLAEERAKAEAERKIAEAKAKKEKEVAATELKVMEAKAAEAKAEAEAKLKAEKAANEKLLAEIKAKADAERKAIQAQEERDEAEKAKGDKEKMKDFISELEVLTTKFSFKSKKYSNAYKVSVRYLEKLINNLKTN